MTEPAAPTSLRLDKWLWFARLTRTRSLAARSCADGQVSIGGQTILKPHHPVKIGDRVSISNGRWRRQLTVRALGTRRGPAPEARLLYDEPTAAVSLRDWEAAWEPLLGAEEADQAD